jgi:hypothetical protein
MKRVVDRAPTISGQIHALRREESWFDAPDKRLLSFQEALSLRERGYYGLARSPSEVALPFFPRNRPRPMGWVLTTSRPEL